MTDTFYDKPIQGTISHYSDPPTDQHHPDDLIDALDALVSLPEVAKIRWQQYTPYFNDGDACVFNARRPEVLLVIEAKDEEDYDQARWRDKYDLFIYGEGETWEDRRNAGKYEVLGVNTERVMDLLTELEDEMDHHTVILSEKFGDPAEVIYDGEKFVVEYYDHD